jgi:hypothetical protein
MGFDERIDIYNCSSKKITVLQKMSIFSVFSWYNTKKVLNSSSIQSEFMGFELRSEMITSASSSFCYVQTWEWLITRNTTSTKPDVSKLISSAPEVKAASSYPILKRFCSGSGSGACNSRASPTKEYRLFFNKFTHHRYNC